MGWGMKLVKLLLRQGNKIVLDAKNAKQHAILIFSL
jgi:hypothetical protein